MAKRITCVSCGKCRKAPVITTRKRITAPFGEYLLSIHPCCKLCESCCKDILDEIEAQMPLQEVE